jgi:hypothetical protein
MCMKELVELLKTKAGLSETQAMASIATIADYIKGKLPPGFEAMVNNFFKDESNMPSNNNANFASHAQSNNEPSFLDKAKAKLDQLEDKFEDLIEKAEDKGEEAIDKLKDLFKK